MIYRCNLIPIKSQCHSPQNLKSNPKMPVAANKTKQKMKANKQTNKETKTRGAKVILSKKNKAADITTPPDLKLYCLMGSDKISMGLKQNQACRLKC